ncbi:putative tRNA pseudouridine synthase [Ordospora pajunii]|uniref:putative tRNA pseudouridine synthase n=1 Tax=Ordospora pajunii TaxID=3039483 RepID=UPI00295292E2|nr:putative tRNA pseudouridine synthase [Ordospora pajunii]KAH9411609.1 putative tRNA pseudouridine synthase [Ordospora pajunii]
MKIRVGLLLGYNGSAYHGLQLNNDLHTIEKTIAQCLLSTGAITQQNAEDPRKIHIKSSSRTDKGVHAAFNLVSVKISVPITPEFVSCLRNTLSQECIHLYDVVRLPKSIIPSKQADARIYEYVVPTFFLMQSNFSQEVDEMQRSDMSKEKFGLWREYPESLIDQVVGYTSPKEDIQTFNEILQKYLGTQDFHNFTKQNTDKGTKRYIRSITVSDTYTSDGIEYIKLEITGQSFLLHQIRKMVFFAMLLCRYQRSSIDIKFGMAFGKQTIHVPKSPSQYLLLDKPIFHRLRKGSSIECIEVDEIQREEYKKAVIYPEIHQRKNLIGFFASFDSVRFHRENMIFLD